jgi:membrane associated rhomboid family serine protease
MASLVLIAFVVVGSALLAFLERAGVPSLRLAPLSPLQVLSGELWRLFTWGLFEADGQNLVFGSLMLGIFGRDLAGLWGGVRYLLICALTVFGAGFLTTLLGIVSGDVNRTQYLSIWPLADALIVAWALLFPNRTILFMLMLPAAGKNLLYLTVGMTGLFAIMYGFSNFVPHFLAMGLMYAYIRGGTVIAAQLRVNRLLAPKRSNPGFKVVEGGRGNDSGKNPNGSGWVH